MSDNMGRRERINRDVDDIAGFFGTRRGMVTSLILLGVVVIGIVGGLIWEAFL